MTEPRVFEVATGKELQPLKAPAEPALHLGLWPNGQFAAVLSMDRKLMMQAVNLAGAPVVENPPGAPKGEPVALEDVPGNLSALAFSPDSRRVAVGSDQGCAVLDVATRRIVQRLPTKHTIRVRGIAFAGPSTVVTAGEDKQVCIWDVEKGQVIKQFEGHAARISALAVAADGKRALLAGGDYVRNEEDKVVSRNGRNLTENCEVRVWNLQTGKEERKLGPMDGLPADVAISADGRRALAVDGERAYFWDVDSGRLLFDLKSKFAWRRHLLLPDGKTAVLTSGNGAVRLVDVDAQRESRTLAQFRGAPQTLGHTADGRYVLAGGESVLITDQNPPRTTALHVFEVATGKEVQRLEGGGKRGIARAVLSPDGKFVVSTATVGEILLWAVDLKAGTPVVKPPDPGKPPVVKKQAVPEEEMLKKEEKRVKALFNLDSAKTKAERTALAAKLLETGKDTKDNPAARFVLFRESRDLAEKAGDAAAVSEAVNALDEEFEVDVHDMQEKALSICTKNAAPGAPAKAVAEVALAAADEAARAERFDVALKLLSVAEPAAFRGQALALRTKAQARDKEVRETQKEAEKVKALVKTLKAKPEDPEANDVTGRYLCLRLGDWDRGLPYLVKSNDADFAGAAKKDLAKPTTGQAQMELGNSWWALAEKEKGLSAQAELQRRAAFWYQQAATTVTGIDLEDIEKRIKQVTDATGELKPQVTAGELRRFTEHADKVLAVAFSADGKRAISGGADKVARVWDVDSGKEVRKHGHAGDVRWVGLKADGSVAVSADAGRIEVFDVNSPRGIHGYQTKVQALALTAERADVLHVYQSGHVNFWYWDGASKRREVGKTWKPAPQAAAVSADGSVVVCGGADGVLHRWDSDAQKELTPINAHPNSALVDVAVSQDGKRVVTCGADRAVRIWDLGTGRNPGTFRPQSGKVTSVAISADGKRIVVGCTDRTVRVLDGAGGREVRRLTGHTEAVNAVALTADGKLALSGSDDKTVRLWELAK